MILSSPEELNALLPTNVLQDPRSLLTLMEQTERSYIIPILGKPLYDSVQSEYNELRNGSATDADGNSIDLISLLAPQQHEAPSKLTPMQELIKLVQVPLAYMTLANNPGLLSVSLNAAGMNEVRATGYDPASKDSRDAFAKDCYLNAHRGTEQVLLCLEEDAQTENPVFLEQWMKSSYFFRQNGLLIRTAIEFDRFVSISESRETYLSLLPQIRNVQDNRLRPAIGDTLLNAFIQFATFGPQKKKTEQGGGESEPNAIGETQTSEAASCHIDEWKIISSSTTSDEAFDEDLRSFLPIDTYSEITPNETYNLRTWKKALALLRSALAYYVEDSIKKLKRTTSYEDAMSNMDRAMKFIAGNTLAFEGVIEDSPLFIKPDPVESHKTPDCDGAHHGYESERTWFIHDPMGSYYH